ncbi:DnaB-like helicase C-terminal domain-containing protein [Candidatus Vidania fulgoroideorum]
MINIEIIEKTLLGVFLIDNSLIKYVIKKLNSDDFFFLKNKIIYENMIYFYEKKKFFDIITLYYKIRKFNLINLDYLNDLLKFPKLLNLKKYIKIIFTQSVIRKIKNYVRKFEINIDKNEILNSIENLKLKIKTLVKKKKTKIFNFSKAYNYIKKIYKKKNKNFHTGFKKLDSIFGGFSKGDLIILAGRPSMGKTALALNFGKNISKKDYILIFSLEMSIEQITKRLVCSIFGKFIKNKIKKQIKRFKILIDDSSILTPESLKKKLSFVKNKVKLIIIDYIQLMTTENQSSRNYEITEISRSLKEIAKNFNISIIALSQLNRSIEYRDNKTPILSDIRESGSIEQDADIIIFLHRENLFSSENKLITNILIAKNRNGCVGETKLNFLKKSMIFRE